MFLNCFPFNIIQKPIYSSVLNGGLGNRLFQIASIYGLSLDHKANFKIYPEYCDENPHSDLNHERFYKKFLVTKTKPLHYYQEPFLEPAVFQQIPKPRKNMLFEGYFQTEKYFKNYRLEIVSLFGPSSEEKKIIAEEYGDLSNAWFLHVRLGDYLQSKMHYVELGLYYEICLDKITKSSTKPRILISTDDKEECIKRYPFLSNFEFISETDEVKTMHIMSLCERGGICANSTFSWWPAWLNESPNKTIYMPKPWFYETKFRSDDIYFDGVNVVDVSDSKIENRA